jgi:hypothetical protein
MANICRNGAVAPGMRVGYANHIAERSARSFNTDHKDLEQCMVHQWTSPDDSGPTGHSAAPPADLTQWAELFATTIAHLAAQLTMTQLRLRALATAVAEQGGIDPAAVQSRLASLADAETGRYLRQNLGEDLAGAIELDDLERDVIAFLKGGSAQ